MTNEIPKMSEDAARIVGFQAYICLRFDSDEVLLMGAKGHVFAKNLANTPVFDSYSLALEGIDKLERLRDGWQIVHFGLGELIWNWHLQHNTMTNSDKWRKRTQRC